WRHLPGFFSSPTRRSSDLDARVEVLQLLSVLPRDLEPCDWVCHFDFLLLRTDGRFSRLNCNVSVEADNRLSVVLRKRDNFARARDPLGASVTTARGFSAGGCGQ